MFTGMTREQIVCATLALAEVFVACSLLGFARSPTEVALCGLAAVAGLVAFGLAWEA